ncbi:hypothetical protein C1645_732928 [Glomus cerebriforme]|uniref:Uncharacterized protein n=1 Tax=Glomus cerebriforme TaxID=658196 RepID=A0A397TJ50_9GLOM|nr:hypothetical protein C1645_732928 [Glomus cerebriforme]
MGTILSNNRTQKMKRDKAIDCYLFILLKYLLRDVLDLTAEEIQHAKKQRNKLPENTSEWAYDAKKIRNEATDIKILKYEVNDNNDKMTDLNLDYLLNLAKMNLIQPEDLGEIGESSQSQKNHEKKEVKRGKKS